MTEDSGWDIIIEPKSKIFDLKIRELIRYKDLLFLFVRRDLVAQYKQTILGPLWYFIQPVLTTLTYTLIFGNIAGLSTDGLPKMLFYMAGVTCWRYFADSLIKTSDTFTKNAQIFGKVYFPRAIVPMSVTITNLVTFGIQLLLFFGFYGYYKTFQNFQGGIQLEVVFFPVLVIIMMFLGLGVGLMLSALTTKYRDLKFLVTFGVQLLMYSTPVIYPLSSIPEKYKIFILANPMTGIIETFRFMFLGTGELNYGYLGYSALFSFSLFVVGLIVFNRTEKNFMDTV
ncbi:lipopolysaccharide transport system permease protein [Roseivirga ehrenbergii]|uniref:Transport permease protein n=1 Tax=Roseivirga ehrenbergii (strain DSM 102268 / JCM 13514 / KCTC 12282 / NCIMB 14502 / KMM 6017) TaxID=279360 RepID=A0A150XE78_ROSEK|nr:ABC transporter permease [Roseivirga ehrenbergii]KYG77035.1 ABC transporter permease [Roseivirga ehrenbergii]TCL14464.1 lipopolysaccharide transport system permease protein [Roseivirga ehrenbergii]